jgi:hypothetical protein
MNSSILPGSIVRLLSTKSYGIVLSMATAKHVVYVATPGGSGVWVSVSSVKFVAPRGAPSGLSLQCFRLNTVVAKSVSSDCDSGIVIATTSHENQHYSVTVNWGNSTTEEALNYSVNKQNIWSFGSLDECIERVIPKEKVLLKVPKNFPLDF